MRKTIIFFVITLCLFLSGCGHTKINDLIDMVNDNPTEYFGDYDELQYISSEYVAENEGYYLLYQGKYNNNNIIRTYNLKAHFYNSNDEWILHEVEQALTNAYLDIVGTSWETIPKKSWTSYVNIGADIKILDVAEDSESISIMYGTEKIKFKRIRTERDDINFYYGSVNRNEPISLSYNTLYSNGEVKVLLYFGNLRDGSMPDLEYTLAD